MKLGKNLAVITAVIMILGLAKLGSAEGINKIGFVDLGRVFDEYQKTKDADQTLEGETAAKQAEREKMVKEIRKVKDELELMSKEAKEKKQEEMDEKIKSLQDFDREVNTELKRKRDTMVREILREIDATIQEYGQKEKYDVIFDNRVLLYSSDLMNVTDQILKIVDERYKRNQ